MAAFTTSSFCPPQVNPTLSPRHPSTVNASDGPTKLSCTQCKFTPAVGSSGAFSGLPSRLPVCQPSHQNCLSCCHLWKAFHARHGLISLRTSLGRLCIKQQKVHPGGKLKGNVWTTQKPGPLKMCAVSSLFLICCFSLGAILSQVPMYWLGGHIHSILSVT